MVLPKFITFTGVDERTSLAELQALSEQYPVEFGILISEGRQADRNEPRYPSQDYISDILDFWPRGAMPVKFALHVCGAYARQIVGTSAASFVGKHIASRIQINVSTPNEAEMLRAAAFGRDLDVQIIFQARDKFPAAGTLPNVLAQWLFDASGGEGIRPKSWPLYQGLKLHGYAGGISPDNVVETLAEINSTGDYWIDMESGVRTGDWLNLAKCRDVCEKVYGADYRKP